MKRFTQKLVSLGLLASAGTVALAAVVVGGYYYVEPSLPDAAELRNIEIQVPLSVYSRDGKLLAQFGEQKRNPVTFDEIPDRVVRAFLAAEDDSFFEHPGIDLAGTVRSAVRYIAAGGERVPGASTITQQVARQNFLSRDFSLVRKFREWIMAVRIEREFSKEEILELFLNTTFLGQRSYGIAAAARTYFNKELAELSIAEAALIAGIPQGPSYLNPVSGPDAARDRRAYVLRRLLELRWITATEFEQASTVPVSSTMYGARIEANAPYVAELVRSEMLRRYGASAYTAGLRVTATVDSRLQAISNRAIQQALRAYDKRHGYRGPLAQFQLPDTDREPARLRELLADYPPILDYATGIVVAVEDEIAQVFTSSQEIVSLGLEAVAWARTFIDDNEKGPAPKSVVDVLAVGDVIRLRADDTGQLELAQIPDVQGAFASLDPFDGAIVALNGGYDFGLDNFNRATQSLRQPGSAFKPFTLSAALDNGMTLATIVNDSPILLAGTEQEQDWRPRNSSNRFYGDIPLRRILEQSINVAAVRVVMDIGLGNIVPHVRKFGFSDVATPRNLGIALGAGGVAPLELATGYAAFANGGLKVEPYFIQRIEDSAGNVLFEAQPKLACADCNDVAAAIDAETTALVDSDTAIFPPLRRAQRIISPQNAYLVTDMMKGVILRGTGRRARVLERSDLAGKTGTTNDGRDTWFAGFNADLVAVSWVGFNQDRSLGRGEEGASTALPMWISFMGEALAGVEAHAQPMPPGIGEVRINPENGLAAGNGTAVTVFEKFDLNNVPPRESDSRYGAPATGVPDGETPGAKTQPIF